MSFVKCYFVRSRWRKLKRLFEDESWRQALKLRRKYRKIATWQLICWRDHEINASVTHVMDQNPVLQSGCPPWLSSMETRPSARLSGRWNTRPTGSISFTERGIYFSMRTCCSSAISASLLSLVAIYKYSWRICLYAILRITRYPGLWPVKLFIIRCLQHSINTVRSWEKLLSTLLDGRL